MKALLSFALLLLFSGCYNPPPQSSRIEVMQADGYTDSCIYKVLAVYGVKTNAYRRSIYKVHYSHNAEVLRIELDKCELKLAIK